MTIIALAGKARSGKSTVASILKKANFKELSFAAPIRQFTCQLLGCTLEELEVIKEVPQELFDGKTPRYFMQTLGTEFGRNISPNLWINHCLNNLVDGENYVLSDVRFENEADAIRSKGGRIVHIIRPNGETTALSDHASEKGIGIMPGDALIYNHGTIEVLEKSILQLL